MERRNFLLAASGLLGATGLGQAAALAALPPTPSQIRMAGFRQLQGQRFNLYQSKRGTSADLVEVKEGKAYPRLEQFTLLFATPDQLAPGVYEVEHAAIGRLSLYLHAAGQGAQGLLYRAEFSLLV